MAKIFDYKFLYYQNKGKIVIYSLLIDWNLEIFAETKDAELLALSAKIIISKTVMG